MLNPVEQFGTFRSPEQISPEPVVVTCDDGSEIEVRPAEFDQAVETDSLCEAITSEPPSFVEQVVEPSNLIAGSVGILAGLAISRVVRNR